MHELKAILNQRKLVKLKWNDDRINFGKKNTSTNYIKINLIIYIKINAIIYINK